MEPNSGIGPNPDPSSGLHRTLMQEATQLRAALGVKNIDEASANDSAGTSTGRH